MKTFKIKLCAIVAVVFMASAMYATSITISWGNGSNEVTINVPDEVAAIVNDHMAEITQALEDNGVTQVEANNALVQVNTFYANLSDYGITTDAPYTTTTNGLNGFSDTLTDVLPNTQTQQNVWSEAWIGKLPHFGFGINAGASELDIASLKDAAGALGIDAGGIRDTYALPTVTADIRIGGFVLPFDLGFTICSIDSSKIAQLESAIDPVAFDFFAIGGDVRYALIKGRGIVPKVSIGGGYYYTKGGVEVSNDDAKASLDFKSSTIFLSSQASAKLLFLVPFIGGRVMVTKSNVDWNADIDWSKVYNGNAADKELIANAQSWGILPTSFSGNSSSSYFDNIRPQLYGGIAVDLLILDLTASMSYDFYSKIPSAAVSARISF